MAAEEQAHQREADQEAWQELTPAEQASCHEQLHQNLGAGPDPTWLTPAERYLYYRAVLIPDELDE